MFKIISLLIVVAAIMFSTTYALKNFTKVTGDKGPAPTLERTKQVACNANTLTLNQFVKQFKTLHNEPVTIENLKKAGLMLPKCESGGEYILDGERFHCSIHSKK